MNKKYQVKKDFKSHCACLKVFTVGEVWFLYKVISKKRVLIKTDKGAIHKVKLSRALTNSVEL